MKKKLLIGASLAVLTGALEARTWTSADGSQTFEGELRSYDAKRGMVSVIRPNGVLQTFSQTKLSNEDIEFLKEQANSEPAHSSAGRDPAEMLADQKLGSQVVKATLHRLDGRRFRRAEIDKAPEYYILYYSASW